MIESNIRVFLDDGYTFSIMPKQFYEGMQFHIMQENACRQYGNTYRYSDIKVHFWIVIHLYIQQAAVQLHQLVFDSKAKAGNVFERHIQSVSLLAR